MAMSTANLKDEAITQIQSELTKTKRLVFVHLDDIHFIFGLENDLKGDTHQGILQDAADYFEALPWVAQVRIKWHKKKVGLLYNAAP